jgi:hypothetical protein
MTFVASRGVFVSSLPLLIGEVTWEVTGEATGGATAADGFRLLAAELFSAIALKLS